MALFKKRNTSAPKVTGAARKQMLLGKIKECLDTQGLHYKTMDDLYVLNTDLDCKLKQCNVYVTATELGICATAVCPYNAQPNAYDDVVEFITRLNQDKTCGCFVMDYRDGMISHQNTLACVDGTPTLENIKFTIGVTYTMMEKYGNGLVNCLKCFGNPEHNIMICEEEEL